MKKEKPKIRILHLSDLHAGHCACWWANGTGDSTRYTRLLEGKFPHEKIVEYLQESHGEEFDLIAVTGDLTQTGKSQEFTAAADFVERLRDSLRARIPGRRPYVCVVPGNHDINRQETRQAEAAGVDPSDWYEGKFAGFLDCARRLGINGYDSKAFARERPFVFLRNAIDGWSVIGLNSAVFESHREEDHHGEVLLGTVRLIQQDYLAGFSPWEFRVGLVHHEPVMVPYKSDCNLKGVVEAKGAIETSGLDEVVVDKVLSPVKELKRFANYLHGTRDILEELEELGVQLVLTGHYHLAEPQHYVFTEARDMANPFGHGGITVLRAGSFGKKPNPTFQVLEVYEGNFRFTVKLFPHRLQVSPDGLYLDRREKEVVREFYCQSDRPARVIDGLVRMLTSPKDLEATVKTVVDVSGEEEVKTESDLYFGVKFSGVRAEDFDLIPPDAAMVRHHPLLFLEKFQDAPVTELAQDVQTVIWRQLRFDVMQNTAVYADLPHWSLTRIEPSEIGPNWKCQFAESRYLHYLLLNMGLRYRLLKVNGEVGLRSFREKYLMKSSHRQRYLEHKWETMNDYLSTHRFLGLRTTLQVIFYVPDFFPNHPSGATFLKARSDKVGHFKGLIQLPVGGGFKSVLFGRNDVRNLREAVLEESELETGLTEGDLECIALTVNTRTFCPAFTFVLELSRSRFQTYFEEAETRAFENDEGEKIWMRVWMPKRRPGHGLPRDWWEGEFLISVETSAELGANGEDLYVKLLRSIHRFFVDKRVTRKLDQYVGSCIEMYCPDLRRGTLATTAE